MVDVNESFTRPELNVQRHKVGVHPENIGFILSNSSTDVNRQDHFSYNLTVGDHFSNTLTYQTIMMRTVRPKGTQFTAWCSWDGKQQKSCMAKCYIHINSRGGCSYKTVIFPESGLQTPVR